MNLVTLKINNKEITVQENTLILDAAKEAGFEIPTFCYQANLSGLGSCRMCLIEIEGQKKLQPSCITPVMPNMSVLTDSKQVLSARGAMLEFFLTNHALDCPVCDKGGECELQDMVHKHGPRKGRFGEIKTKFHEKDYVLSPVIVKNSNRCVQCMRCVRVCSEVVGRTVLGALGRGAYQEETSFFKTTLDCDHDGMCIEVCPVGCFMRLPYRYKARPWDLKGASTVCPYCATGCTLTMEKRGDEVVRAIARNEGFNKKMLCARGRFGYDILNNPDRLTAPLVKKGSRFEPISWDKALGIIKEKLSKAYPEKIAAIASPTLTNEELYLLQKLMRGVLKTGNMDSTSRWNESASASFIGAAGIPAGPTDVYGCMDADTVFVVGGHISDENPVTDYIVRYLSRMKRKTLITAGPRALKLDGSALIRLRHLPARVSTLLSAIASSLKGENIEALSADCGANIEDIRLTAETFKSSKAISMMVGTDFLRFRQGAHALKTLSDCLRALGCEVKILPLLDRCNQRGAWDMGVHPSFTPGYGKALGSWLGCDGILDAAQKGTIDALYVIGSDIVSMRPDTDSTINALSKAGFLIVEECFLTDTAKLADIILPGALPAEKTGTFTNQEGRVQRINPLKSPPGEAKTDFEIISLIGGMLGHGFFPLSPQDIMEEIAKNVPSYAAIFGEGSFVKPTGEPMPSMGRAIEISQDEMKIDLDKDPLHPYLLITGNHLLHSGSLSMRSDILKGLLPEPTVEISKDTADLLGVKQGDYVLVKGKGHEARFSLRTKSGTVNNVVFIPENFPSTPAGRFFKKGESVARVDIVPCK